MQHNTLQVPFYQWLLQCLELLHNASYFNIYNAAGEERTRRKEETLSSWQWGPEKNKLRGIRPHWVNQPYEMHASLKTTFKTILKPR